MQDDLDCDTIEQSDDIIIDLDEDDDVPIIADNTALIDDITRRRSCFLKKKI